MIVGICKFSLILPQSRSLKDKRSIVRKLKDKFFANFKTLLAEVADQDLWQRATLGFALVGNDKRLIQSMLDKALLFVEGKEGTQMVDQEVEIIFY